MKKSDIKSQKKAILEFFKNNTDRIYTLNDLFNHLDVYDEQDKGFIRLIIEDLMDEEKLFPAGRNRFTVQKSTKSLTGTLDFVNAKFGFIRVEGQDVDIYVDAEDMHGALDGDTVTVKIIKKGGKNPEGEVLEVTHRKRTEIVGKIKVYTHYALVKPDVNGFREQVFIPKDKIFGASTDDLVIIDITAFPAHRMQATGAVIKILGKAGENNAEMNAIMAEFGLPVDFPTAVIEESEVISEVMSPEEVQQRRDFREILTCTIDPDDAKDFDDALSFRLLENNHFEVGVHIADVSYYVKPGSLIDQEAYRRGTSVYLVDRTVPMLPERLSNYLCSLRPNEDKRVFSAVFELDKEAKIQSQWFGRGIINSDRRLAYEEAQEILDGKSDNVLSGPLNTLNQLAHQLRAARFSNGAMNFETDEVKFKLDENGKPLGVFQRVRKDAHKLIEEFMLLANRQVATYVFKKEPARAMVYRTHEPPNPDKLENFVQFAAKMGYTVKTGSTRQLSSSLNQLITDIEGKPIQNILESLAVRTMSKAKYSTKHLGHFGLAFEHYSHFTSPIRRYPDVMAHRLLALYLENGKSVDEEELGKKCEQCSDTEKLAAEAERASIKYKQVEYMSLQAKNKVYEGVVSGVTDFGIFVEITDMAAEGLVRLAELTDDYYELDSENYRVVGRKSNRIIGFGYSVEVRVLATDLENRSIELALVSVAGKNVEGKAGTRKSGRPAVKSKARGRRRH